MMILLGFKRGLPKGLDDGDVEWHSLMLFDRV